MFVPIKKNPYSEAGIKGFTPYNPHQEPFQAVGLTASSAPVHFPSLSELVAEFDDWDSAELAAVLADDSLCQDVDVFFGSAAALTATPSPPMPPAPQPPVPPLGELVSAIARSRDKLFL